MGIVLKNVNITAGKLSSTPAADANVENSDASYSTTVASGGTLVLPDSQINVNGVDEGDVVSVKTIDVNITDGVDPVTPDSVSLVGNTLTVTVPSGGAAPVGATLMKTGQTTSYRTGDDGDLEAGRDTDFFTLAVNNPFGNTNRFTDELGGSTYTNNIVIDWSTYDNVAGTVLGWDRRINGGNASVNKTWNDAIDESLAHTNGTFTTGWRLPNIREVQNILNYSLSYALGYAPFNTSLSFTYWTSTTPAPATTNAFLYASFSIFGSNYIIQQPKTASSGYRWQAVRTFTVTGTILS